MAVKVYTPGQFYAAGGVVEKYGLSENKPYITRCSQCGKIFINPYYKDPVSESWEKNPPTQIVD